MATTGRGVGNYELDVIHSPALECPFAVMSNDIGLPLFFYTELMPLYAEIFSEEVRTSLQSQPAGV